VVPDTRRMRRRERSMRPRSVPEIEFLSLISQLIKGHFAVCRHALLVGHYVQKVNAAMRAHLVVFQIPGLELADEKGPAHAKDLGSLLRRELSVHWDECHGVTGGHLDQEVDQHTDGWCWDFDWLGKSLYLHAQTVLG